MLMMLFDVLFPLTFAFTAKGLALERSAKKDNPVDVQVYFESGCPHSKKFITDTLATLMEIEGMSEDVVELTLHPFGNSYFLTLGCGGPAYNTISRQCYNLLCGVKLNQSDTHDCFTGPLICQHGGLECIVNQYMACAIDHLDDHVAALPFTVCVMNEMDRGLYDLPEENKVAWNVIKRCAAYGGFDFHKLTQCAHGWQGRELMKKEAMITPKHAGVPLVVIDGVTLEDNNRLHDEICTKVHYVPEDPAPYGCGGDNLALQELQAAREVHNEHVQTTRNLSE